MLKFLLTLAIVTVFAGCIHTPVANPDPNHTHADFAVWINGEKLDFSDAKYMSGSSTDAVHDESHHKYLHLHDGNGNVIHRHKPGLTIGEFFQSNLGLFLGWADGYACLSTVEQVHTILDACGTQGIRMFVNGKEMRMDPDYVFADADKILLTNAVDDAEIQQQLSQLTDDACMFSKTCPWRGDPPTENCVADPQVPCVVQ